MSDAAAHMRSHLPPRSAPRSARSLASELLQVFVTSVVLTLLPQIALAEERTELGEVSVDQQKAAPGGDAADEQSDAETPSQETADGNERDSSASTRDGQADEPASKPVAPPAEGAKRRQTDYDNRDEIEESFGRKLLWIPRIVLFPVYVVSEYVIRWPLGKLISGAERAEVPALLYDIFAFGPDHKAGVYPTAFVDSGFQPSFGAYGFWNDALFPRHDLRLRASFSGNQWISTGFSQRFRTSSNPFDKVAWEISLLRRPDFLYFGTGPLTQQSDSRRYGAQFAQIRGLLDHRISGLSSVSAVVAVRDVNFRPGIQDQNPTLDQAIATGEVAPPALYDRGYDEVRSELSAVWDTRPPIESGAKPESGSGVRVHGQVRHSVDLQNNQGSWVRYGGIAGAFLDLNGHHRVLSLAATARLVDPIGDTTIPFTELVTLGGDREALVGFFPGRLVGESAAALSLSYRWPIWIWLDGLMRLEVGNVFGHHFEGFRPGLLRYSASIAIVSRVAGESEFQAVIGFGSNPFETGGKIDSVRFTLGTSYDF